jgi:hypothetical protein
MVTPGAKRDAVAHARGCYGLGVRRACHLIGIARRVARYQPSRPDDTDLRQRLRALAAVRLSPGPGGAEAAPPRRPETGAGDQGANGAASRAEPALVAGFCL